MIRLITKDDFVETYFKMKQRGLSYIFSKFSLDEHKRIQSTWDDLNLVASNWWDIPAVDERWNYKMTGDRAKRYEVFFTENFTKPTDELRLLSLGSGNCRHELVMASYPQFEEITCVDLSEKTLEEAKKKADTLGLENINFLKVDANDFDFTKKPYDVIFFNMSLHHFKNISEYLGKRVYDALKPNGKLVLNEFVGPNRLQLPKSQIDAINECIGLIPEKYRTRLNSSTLKNTISGPGIVRMIVTDPSECVDSAAILPTLEKKFVPLHQTSYGGELLMIALKDIAHHFVELNDEKERVLQKLFDFEEKYLENNPINFLFGIYEKKHSN